MKIAIIGGSGYIGQHLSRHLVSTGQHEVVHYVRTLPSDPGNRIVKELDVTRIDFWKDFDDDFDQIYFLAGITGTLVSFEKYSDFINTNELGLLNLLNGLRSYNNSCKVIFPSTRLVYKGKENVPLDEESEKEFKTLYATTKYNGELYLRMYKEYYGIDYTIVRICVPYGNSFDKNYSYGTIGFFLTNASTGKDISLYGGGSLKRTFTHVEDIVSQMTLVASARASSGEVYNIGGEKLSLFEVASKIAHKYGVRVQAKAWPELDLKVESGDTIFDSQKIEALLGYKAQFTFDQWLNSL